MRLDLDGNRLEVATSFGATRTINSGKGKAAEQVMALTGGRGVDVFPLTRLSPMRPNTKALKVIIEA